MMMDVNKGAVRITGSSLRLHLSVRTMLRPSCFLLPALRRTPPHTALISRYISVYTPAQSTSNGQRALPLSDAQRKTIYALSTAPAKSGVAVIRVSGPDALGIWQKMLRPTTATHINQNHDERKRRRTRERNDKTSQQLLPEAWKLQRCHVVDPQTSELLDDALAVFFRGAPPLLKPISYLSLTRKT